MWGLVVQWEIFAGRIYGKFSLFSTHALCENHARFVFTLIHQLGQIKFQCSSLARIKKING